MITASLRASATLALRMPAAPGDAHRPAFERRAAFDRLGQHDMGGLVERLAHRGIADLADPAGVVGLAGLILLRRQAEMGAGLLRRPKPGRVVDGARIGERHDRADRRRRHQQPGLHMLARHDPHPLAQSR